MQHGLWDERRGFVHDVKVLKWWLGSREGQVWKWSFAAVACIYLAAAVALRTWHLDLPPVKEQKQPHTTVGDLMLLLTPAVLFVVSGIAAVTFKAQLIRLNHRLETKHADQYRASLMREFAAKQDRWYAERDEWKAKKQAELYEMILDQVERGVLKPRDGGSSGSYDFPDRDY